MQNITQNSFNYLKQNGREFNVVFNRYSGSKIYTHEVHSIKVIDNTSLFNSVMKTIEVETTEDLEKITHTFYTYSIKIGREEIGNTGFYIIYNKEYNEDSKLYKFTMCDFMLNSMVEYKKLQTALTFPTSLKNYLEAILKDLGMNLDTDTFPNSTRIVQSDLYAGLGYTYRDILDQISQCSGSNIMQTDYTLGKVNPGPVIEVLPINNITSEIGGTITPEYIRDINVKFNEKYGPINSVVLSRSAESDNIYKKDNTSIGLNGLCEIKFKDNMLMNNNDRVDYLNELFNQINGIEYYLCDYNSIGLPYIELLDQYNVEIDNKTYKCLMLNSEMTLNGGIEQTIYTEMPEVSETDYTKADETDRRINQTYLIVDKQNGEINALINELDEDNKEGKYFKLNARVDELESEIGDIADITRNEITDTAYIDFDETVNPSEPIDLIIRPVGEDISYLYPCKDNILDVLNEKLEYCGRKYYQEFYYIQIGTTHEAKVRFLSKFESVGIKFYLKDISKAKSSIKEETFNKYVDYLLEYCDADTTRVIVYPHEDYYETDYTIVNEITQIKDIDKIYPSQSLFPKIREIVFENEHEEIDPIVWTLPSDLRIMGDKFDSLELHYNEGENTKVCFIRRNIGIDEYGSKYVLEEEQIETLEYPDIILQEGKYKIYLTGYGTGHIEIRLMIKNLYANQFATKVEMKSAIKQSTQEISTEVDKKIYLINGEIEETNSKITQTDAKIQAEVTRAKGEEELLSSSITQTAESIKSEVTRATSAEATLSSSITQTAEEITSEVSRAKGEEKSLSSRIQQKVDSISLTVNNDGTTSGIVISARNEKGEITTTSGTINMYGLVKFTDLANSGSTTINGANITTGTISADRVSGGTLTGTIIKGNTIDLWTSNALNVYGTDQRKDCSIDNYGFNTYDDYGNRSGRVTAGTNNGEPGIALQHSNGSGFFVGPYYSICNSTNGIGAFNFYHISKEEYKKNIKIYKESCLDKVINSDIYTFNYKQEEKDSRKHIGFIIGDKYQTPKEVIANDGIDLYSMISVLWKATQEQQILIEELKKEIEELKKNQ